MAYKYDVFISYQRKRFGFWVRGHFVKFLDRYLEDALGEKPKIFIDEHIETGEVWPKSLAEALACSKCIVCVWSPSYFESEWCTYECRTMIERNIKVGGNKRLVLAVNVSDGDGFPDWAKEIHWCDLRDYVFEGKGFENTPDYIVFQRIIRRYAAEVKNAIHDAPRWRRKWLQKPELNFPTELPPKVSPPLLG